MFFDRIGAACLCIGLAGCVATPTLDSRGGHLETFVSELAAEPDVCQIYREAYVSGFRANVEAIAEDDPVAGKMAQAQLEYSRQLLLDQGLSGPDCTRPYCIIEPLQNGKLDSWCGFRLDADQGEELYQWLSYPDLLGLLSSQ
ncbi:hypothetical protein [Marinobacter gelidimuriae]|uniref:hypothetical protein n=1 Tax=Marinobacter gelidimuriae TaxID=2739064 RepID=UPI000376B0EC|nr:hypothetical protein [Marinobacter gelidimuriae]